MPINLKCLICEKPISLRPSQVKIYNFCSRGCYYQHKARNRAIVECYRCGTAVTKSPSSISERNFCSRACNLQTMNEEMNPFRMTFETRMALRRSRLGKGEGKTYPKILGRHAHRVAAEIKLGRPLLPDEVVHHEDENKRNYSLDNLTVFSSQSEHVKHHMQQRGDAL